MPSAGVCPGPWPGPVVGRFGVGGHQDLPAGGPTDGCPFTAVSSRGVLAAGDTTALPALSTTGHIGAMPHAEMRARSGVGALVQRTLNRSIWPGAGPRRAGMVFGMATRKVTVTLQEAQLDQIRKLVDAGSASSVSGFVQHAVAVAIDDVAGWGALLAEALRESGGPLTDEERAWADDLLGTRRRRRGSAA